MKELITAMRVSEARKTGRSSIAVPPGALVTPQARDDAAQYGIELVFAVGCPDAFVASGDAPYKKAVRHTQTPRADFGAVERGVFESVNKLASRMAGQSLATACSSPLPPASAPLTNCTELAGMVLQKVLQALSAANDPVESRQLERTVAEVIAEHLGGALGRQPVSARISEASVGPETNSVSRQSCSANSAGSELPGVQLIRGGACESGTSPSKLAGEVSIDECVAPGLDGSGGPGVTRLDWADSSFAWTFEFDEVLVVTHGRVEASHNGSALLLESGDALRVRAGGTLTLKAIGRASCVGSSWPAPEHS